MNEKTNDAEIRDTVHDARGCDRAEDFVAYLYGEASPEDAKIFRQHLDACAVCRDELAAFGGVREAVGAWREEALGFTPSLVPRETVTGAAAERKRSAMGALREFFALSPLWLRAGALATMLLVCALAALTLARSEVRWDANGVAFQTGIGERVVTERVEVPVPTGYTQAQLDAIVSDKVNAQLAVARAQWEANEKQDSDASATNGTTKRATPRLQEASATPARQARTRQAAPVKPPRSQQQYLADEDNLPRLSDLLSEVN